jgi:hypothetical protein
MPSIINATTSTGLVSSADNSGSLQLATNNGTTAVTIDTSQNVGIGTTTPAAKIAIFGGTNQWGQFNFGNTAEDGPTPLLGSLNNVSPSAAVNGWGLYDSNATGNLVLYRRNSSTTGNKTAEWNRGNGNFSFDSGYGTAAVAYGCRAWANFAGSNGAVSGSGNISSVSRTGTGLYQVNFSTAMPDANYSVCTAVKPTSGQGSTNGKVANIRFDNSLSTSFFVIYTYSNGGAEDFDRVLVSVFR